MKTSLKRPAGFQIPPGTPVIMKTLPGDAIAVKCHPEFDDEHIYLVCSASGVSMGELLTLAEVHYREVN